MKVYVVIKVKRAGLGNAPEVHGVYTDEKRAEGEALNVGQSDPEYWVAVHEVELNK